MEKTKEELESIRDNLEKIEETHETCKSRQLKTDKEILDKSDKIKTFQIEMNQLEKMLETKNRELSDELVKTDSVSYELNKANNLIREYLKEVSTPK